MIIIIIIIIEFNAYVIGTNGLEVEHIYNYLVINKIVDYYPYRAQVMATKNYLYYIVINYIYIYIYIYIYMYIYHMLQHIVYFNYLNLAILL